MINNIKRFFALFCVLSFSTLIQTNTLLDMSIMMGAQIGANTANQAISKQYSDMAIAIEKEQNNIENSITLFQSNITKAQKKDLVQIFDFFKQAQTKINETINGQSAMQAAMIDYINSIASLNPPQTNYLAHPTSLDILFTLATMYTPDGPVWKNVFPVGNWGYDETSDSFWQMAKSLMLPSPNTKTNNAINNLIFTEWITSKSSYKVSCEITLHDISYPCFVGLVFNKSRWISGDATRIQKYRLLGIYIKSPTLTHVCYSEPLKSANNSTTYPLENIITGLGVQPVTIKIPSQQSLRISPITFKLTVTTTPQQVNFKIWNTLTSEPENMIKVKSKNSDLFLYHDIGFMAPGAAAEFKLLEPTCLLFSSKAKSKFITEVNALTKIGKIS